MELPKRFESKENPINYINRAPAVAGLVFALTKDEPKVLIGKRGKRMQDSPNKLGIPCGYLNWKETLHEGMMREVYEETSFYMPDYDDFLLYNHNKFPFLIKDQPTEPHENVTMVYISIYDFEGISNDFLDGVENFKCRESQWTRWLPIREFFETRNPEEWAFKHDETIVKGWNVWNSLPYVHKSVLDTRKYICLDERK
jgi:ADP-ribose pyrophosphatase YjhB (NUDIX family)